MRDCQCVFPRESEQELVTVPGKEPGTAVRVYLQAGTEGYVRIQHLCYDAGLGWYVQKSMVVERDVLEVLIPELRKGLCMMPKGNGERAMKLPLVPPTEESVLKIG